jgi:hypothetical protein
MSFLHDSSVVTIFYHNPELAWRDTLAIAERLANALFSPSCVSVDSGV